MTSLLPDLLHQSLALRALDVVKMGAFVPCEVADALTGYRNTIVEVVFDPVRAPEVDERFRKEGFLFDEGMHVIAVNADGSILLWGGLNSVFHLRRSEHITGAFDEGHLAFQDILDLTARFKIKNKRGEINAVIAAVKERYESDDKGRAGEGGEGEH
jgi:hypothetical protein